MTDTTEDPWRRANKAHRWWLRPLLIGAGIAVGFGVVLALGLRLATGNTPRADASSSLVQPTNADSAPPQTGASATATVPPGRLVSVPVYYVGRGKAAVRLYREFRQVPLRGQSLLAAAVETMFDGQPADPDYRTVWPKGTKLLTLTKAGNTAIVDVSDVALTGSERKLQTVGVQQLVYTVTAADNSITRVSIRVGGAAATRLWGGPLVDAPVARAPQLDTLGQVWLDVANAATITGPLPVTGQATVFEATVTWQILRNGVVVRRGIATATAGAPQRGIWKAPSVSLPPGTYQLQALAISPESGAKLFTDTKTITVVTAAATAPSG
jgi:hypothetical protein